MVFIFKFVDRCPRDEIEWKERDSLFNCSAWLHHTQKEMSSSIFTKVVNYKYHCVLTGDGDRLVEVCAPSVNIHGNMCTEFNLFGKRIQESFVNCTGACPDLYNSTEAYKYQLCYDRVSQANKSNVTSFFGSEETECSTFIVSLYVIAYLIIALAAILCCWKYIIKQKYYKDAGNPVATEDASGVTKHQTTAFIANNSDLEESVYLENE